MLDLTGKKFGLLSAKHLQGTDRTSRTKLWFLECECGNEVTRTTSSLVRGKKDNLVQSCGCWRSSKLDTGQKFGWLTVIRRLDRKAPGKGWLWEFTCVCGNTTEKYGSEIARNHGAQHCGCKLRKKGPDTSTGVGLLSGKKWSAIVYGATRRGLDLKISLEYASNLFDKQNGRCAISGLPITLPQKRDGGTASLDRKNSAIGYTEENIQWVHKDINRAKGNLSDDAFIRLCRCVVENNGVNQ